MPTRLDLTFAIAGSRRNACRERLLASLAHLPCEILYEDVQPRENVSDLRNRLFAQAQGSYVYFLDDDCEWPADYPLDQLQTWLETGFAFSGPYKNTSHTTWFGSAYNAMTAAWMKRHSVSGAILAGNCLIPKSIGTDPFAGSFGGEEASLRARLKQAGIAIHYRENMAVGHSAQHTLKTFFARAWLHGRAPHMPSELLVRTAPRFQPLALLALGLYLLTERVSRAFA